jgi:hypothetical protein
MQVQTWLFGIPLTLGVILVVCSALGAAELDATDGWEAAAIGGAIDDHGLLAWLGLGRVPAIIIAMFLLLIFGTVGLLLCTPLSAAFGSQAGFFATLPIASLSAFFGTSLGARGLARIMPRTESYAPRSSELLGRSGRVSVRLDAERCIVRVLDSAGAEHRLRCRIVSAAATDTLAVGDSVQLTAREQHEYLVHKL